MPKQKFRVAVTQVVEVNLDPTKFTEDFMQEFRESYYPFRNINQHAEHIAQMHARGLYDLYEGSNEFIEGYGRSDEMGITALVVETEIDPVT